MENVKMSVKDSILTIEVDLSIDLGPSKSGKTIMIASSQGNQSIPDCTLGETIGLNIYRKAR